MIKIIFSILFFLILIFSPGDIFAKTNSFISVVNPVRGNDFWDLNNQKITDAIKGQVEILEKYNLPATWLIRFDALIDEDSLTVLKERESDERGLFLEVTPTWAKQAGVEYHQSESWHNAASVLLTGYEPTDREKLIDKAFDKFKETFGNYPRSVGAWWIDSHSLSYMQEKYGITGALIVSDQYTTDNYQIWGQYFSTPYYPSKNNALHPAQTLENKLPIVITQWAPRDPINAYGNGVFESTFSVQPNDYVDFHDLNINYFSKLVDLYTNQNFNKFSHMVIGLENSYSWEKYQGEYENQIRTIKEKQRLGQVSVLNLQDFSRWYQSNFPQLSPEQIIIADDPLGSSKKVVWFMNSFYRAGWFFNKDGSVFRDIRQYVDGEEELCLKKRCDEVNFATFATRVLDEVTFGHKWVIDDGKINNFKVSKSNFSYVINYVNEAGKNRRIEFLPRDIGIDEKISSIDTIILEATKRDISKQKKNYFQAAGYDFFNFSLIDSILQTFKFGLFLVFVLFLPGLLFVRKIFDEKLNFFHQIFLSVVLGLTFFVIIFYVLSILKIRFLIYLYPLAAFLSLRKFSFKNSNFPRPKSIFEFMSLVVILAGTIFQVLPVFKSGLLFPFGLGFWGPNTHDGVWHISLINQLIKSVPPENPIFSGQVLKNYHYFYDLLIAATFSLTGVPVADLVFRFYPVIFSLSLGVGSYYLFKSLFSSKTGVLFSLYLIYFAGSFGWIVEFIREKHIGGESAFWANQAVSFNLNPPFAVSLIIIIALFQILQNSIRNKTKLLTAIILGGTLISFKAYGGILVLATLLISGLINMILKKGVFNFVVFIFASSISLILYLSNFKTASSPLVFSPFWFIHSMIDSPDRVGWERLSLARVAGMETKNWFKFFTSEIISFIIFLFGNLGVRFFSLGLLFKIKIILKNRSYLMLFIFSLLSAAIPILFIQTGNPWNTIQFFYYYLYISALIAGAVISWLLLKLPRLIALILTVAILAVAPVNSMVTASAYLANKPHAFISPKELAGLNFLSKQPEGIVLTYPYDKRLKEKIEEPWPLLVYDSTSYVSALAKKASYLEDEGQNQILLTDYKKRIVAAKDFFSNPNPGIKFLEENKIKYVYLPKIFNLTIDESQDINNIFENEEVIIYRFGD